MTASLEGDGGPVKLRWTPRPVGLPIDQLDHPWTPSVSVLYTREQDVRSYQNTPRINVDQLAHRIVKREWSKCETYWYVCTGSLYRLDPLNRLFLLLLRLGLRSRKLELCG